MNESMWSGPWDEVIGAGAGIVRGLRDPKLGALVNIPQRLVYHSPTGFEWGYGGSGPADLALNILALFVSPSMALRMHQDFKSEVVTRLDRDAWQLPPSEVDTWIRSWLERNRPQPRTPAAA